MITVKLLKANKRINSTKQPSTTSAVSYNCELKDTTNITAPTILINNAGMSSNPLTSYNYAYIQSFNRYYWIVNIIWNKGIWELSLSCDALASHRTTIRNSNQYVLRSASEKDVTIIDSMYPLSCDNHFVYSEIETNTPIWKIDYDDGTYIVGVINSDEDSIGSISYYAFTPEQFSDFKNYLMQNTNDWMDSETIETAASELTESLLKVMLNPFQYLVSCVWMPFVLDESKGVEVEEFTYGWWTIELPCTRVTVYDQVFTYTLSIPKHPQSTEDGDYFLTEPFSSYALSFPPFGTTQIPSTYLRQSDTLTCSIKVDLITGKASLWVGVGTVKIYDIIQQLGVSIQLANVALNTTDKKSVGASIAGGALKNDYTSSIVTGLADPANKVTHTIIQASLKPNSPIPENTTEKVLNGISDGLEASSVIINTLGGNGTCADLYLPARLQLIAVRQITADNTKFGSPLCQSKTLSSLSGFCQVSNPQINADMPIMELNAIISAMSGGFYLE